MRISDWSSDVCSSDLYDLGQRPRVALQVKAQRQPVDMGKHVHRQASRRVLAHALEYGVAQVVEQHRAEARCGIGEDQRHRDRHPRRSEEHTSELQSLMRISSAVFCLKKTKQRKQKVVQLTTQP